MYKTALLDNLRFRVDGMEKYEKVLKECSGNEVPMRRDMHAALNGLPEPILEYARDSNLIDNLFKYGYSVVQIDHVNNLGFGKINDIKFQFGKLVKAWNNNIMVGYNEMENTTLVFVCVTPLGF